MAVEQWRESKVDGAGIEYFEFQACNGCWIDAVSAFRVILLFGMFDRQRHSVEYVMRVMMSQANDTENLSMEYGHVLCLTTGAKIYAHPRKNNSWPLWEGMEFYVTGYGSDMCVREAIISWESR